MKTKKLRRSKHVLCPSGLYGYRGRLRDNYTDFQEFKRCDNMYGLAFRLGCTDVWSAWEENPWIIGSVNPSDFQRV